SGRIQLDFESLRYLDLVERDLVARQRRRWLWNRRQRRVLQGLWLPLLPGWRRRLLRQERRDRSRADAGPGQKRDGDEVDDTRLWGGHGVPPALRIDPDARAYPLAVLPYSILRCMSSLSARSRAPLAQESALLPLHRSRYDTPSLVPPEDATV